MNQRRQKRRKRRQQSHLLVAGLVIILLAGLGWLGVKALQGQFSAKSSPKISVSSHRKSATAKSNAKSEKTKKSTTVSSQPKWLQAKSNNQLPILMFHYVSHLTADLVDSNWMPTATFEADLQALKQNGYTTVTAAQAEKILTTKTKPSNKLVWLTFDDGSLTLYRDIFPLLKKYQMHATAFIITGFTDRSQPGIASWQELSEMKASGLVDFGSHTVDHLDLGSQTSSDQQVELSQSKADLDKHLGQNTDMICYPAGGYNQTTLQLAAQNGYKFGFLDPGRNGAQASAASGADGLLTLPRFRMAATTGPEALLQDLAPAANYNAQNTVK